MATIIKKIKNGKPYFYLVESARVEGKPRIVHQVYLGKAEDLLTRLTERVHPKEVIVREFGASIAVYAMAREIRVLEMVDEVVGKRKQGMSVGTYIVLAAANRATQPCSKSRMSKWYKGSALSSVVKLKENLLAPQRFWDAMGKLKEEEITLIERNLTKRIIDDFKIDPSCLVLDATNFFTFIDTDTKSVLANRGYSKQKRHDLRQIGLVLLVSVDHSIPFSSLCYPGNMSDVKSFAQMTDELVQRYKEFAAKICDITLVFDKGNNSGANLSAIEASPYHFVGSLIPSQHKELLALPLEDFKKASDEKLKGLLTYRTTKEVFGIERTVVVTFCQELYRKQRRGFDQTLAKAFSKLSELKAVLERKRSRRERKEIESQIEKIIEPRFLKDVLAIELTEDKGALSLTFKLDEERREKMEATHFGKRILFTDRSDLSDYDIVKFYRAQNAVESAFRQMKDPTFLSFSPMFHWTDDKIRVHVFYCVVALMLVNLIWRRVNAAGINMSPKAILEELSNIKLVDLVHAPIGGIGRPRIRQSISKLNDVQRQLIRALKLEEYLP